MSISTFNDTQYMTYEYYLQQPMPSIQTRINIILAKNPHLINSLNRFHNHPLIQKDSHISKL